MAKGHINSKTVYKGIRFPHELVKDIDQCVLVDKGRDPGVSFTSWVLDACESKLEVEKAKEAPED